MKTIRNWCSAISCMLLVAIVSGGGAYIIGTIKGYNEAINYVCGDLDFYHDDMTQVRGCPNSHKVEPVSLFVPKRRK